MAKLYFRYGAMRASKTANALMVRYNYEEGGQKVLLAKPSMDKRDGERVVKTRIGLSHPCIWVEELCEMSGEELKSYQCIIVDEAQFLSESQVRCLTYIVDIVGIPVICYGLRTDFKGNLFPGSQALFAWADKIEEIKTICWCGQKATFNARFDSNGTVLKTGEQVVFGANDCYISLCRKHWNNGDLGPNR